jgi:Transcription factor S-II (TFIIS), central domain
MFAESRYSDDAVATDNRHLLLDSLMERTLLVREQVNKSLEEKSRQGPFRNAGRTVFVSALQKALSTLDIADSDTSIAFCAVKAWEIENALFDLYQGDLGESQISSEYREKAKALRRSLEDPGDLNLCVNVLCGKIDPGDLVKMTIYQLANPTVKKDREKATEVARQSVILTGNPIPAKIVPMEKSTENEEVPVPPAEEPVTQWQSPTSSRPTIHTTHIADDTLPPLTKPQLDLAISPSSGTARTISKFGAIVNAARGRGPPPPPPSLVMSLQPAARETSSLSRHGEVLTNSSGGDRFFLSLDEGARTFFATLYAERDPQREADGLLPETLKQKGRIAPDAFTEFISSKLKGGREAVILRLATISENDATEHKKFYKDFEGNKKRMAMFSLDNGDKAFLVTPRFHRIAKGLTFAKSTSTYVVVLTKKK